MRPLAVRGGPPPQPCNRTFAPPPPFPNPRRGGGWSLQEAGEGCPFCDEGCANVALFFRSRPRLCSSSSAS